VHRQVVVLDMLMQAQVAQAEQQVLQALVVEMEVVMKSVVVVAQVAPQEQQ
tara:strand:+ start:375 stop:527 length:153 start_codon:yes stop_codon:yes gene_type:complete